jgi:hypothetical protein
VLSIEGRVDGENCATLEFSVVPMGARSTSKTVCMT